MEYVLLSIIFFIFLILGIVFFCGKGAVLIAGYNTAKANEKKKYDEKALCRSVGVMMFAMAACTLISAVTIVYDNFFPSWFGCALFPVVAVIGIIYVNLSSKVKPR